MSKAIRYIDLHGHLNFPDYDADREDVIERAEKAGVASVVVGTDMESSKKAIELAETHENMWATVGIHPTDVSDAVDFQELRRLALHPKVIAIGECGLDFFHSEPSDIPAQIEAFERQIAIGNEAKKPLMLHVRSGKKRGEGSRNAYAEALDILEKSAKTHFNFHFFAGSPEDMHRCFALGGTISFTGVITFTHDYDDLIKAAPLERLMIETDCPYVAPAPYRGKRNEPSYIVEVSKTIARIRGEDEETVRKRLLENAVKFIHHAEASPRGRALV